MKKMATSTIWIRFSSCCTFVFHILQEVGAKLKVFVLSQMHILVIGDTYLRIIIKVGYSKDMTDHPTLGGAYCLWCVD